MSEPSCSREPEVLRAGAREWRDAADGYVAAHVEECARCAEVRAAAELLRAHHLRELPSARVPSPAAMWWRLERRIREERARRLQRIALATHAVVLAAAAGGAAAVLQIVKPWLGRSSLGSSAVAEGAWQAATAMLTAWTQVASAWTLPIAIAAGAWALLVPAVLYLGLAKE
jgi:hypothetical protein